MNDSLVSLHGQQFVDAVHQRADELNRRTRSLTVVGGPCLSVSLSLSSSLSLSLSKVRSWNKRRPPKERKIVSKTQTKKKRKPTSLFVFQKTTTTWSLMCLTIHGDKLRPKRASREQNCLTAQQTLSHTPVPTRGETRAKRGGGAVAARKVKIAWSWWQRRLGGVASVRMRGERAHSLMCQTRDFPSAKSINPS